VILVQQNVVMVAPPLREVTVSRPHRDLAEGWYPRRLLGGACAHRLAIDGDNLVVDDVDVECSTRAPPN
jgi:hypothetical protein